MVLNHQASRAASAETLSDQLRPVHPSKNLPTNLSTLLYELVPASHVNCEPKHGCCVSRALQVLDAASGQVVDKQVKQGLGSSISGGAPETVLLVMLGGITFSEISALRFLASRPDSSCRFLVLTTKIINGRALLDSFVDPPARNMPHRS